MSLRMRGGSPGVRELLTDPDLCLLLTAGLVSQTRDWAVGTGIAFQVYVLTHSTLASATALLVTQIPLVLLGSVAGVLVDRWDRRRVMVAVNVALNVVILPLMAVHDAERVWVVYAVAAVSSCLTPLSTAAEASLLPALVRRPESLVTANALNAQVRNVARLVGAALGGAIVTSGGLVLLAVTDAASFLFAALAIALVRHRSPPVVVQRGQLVRDWTEGLAVIRRSRALGVLVFFFTLSGIGEAVMGTLFAPFVDDVLGGTARAYGFILATQAIGGIVGGILVTAVGHRFTPRALFGWGAVVFGALDLALFLYPLVFGGVWPAAVVITLVGLPGAALNAGMLTVFQLATTDQVRGRVFGALTTAHNAAMLAATLVAGALADHLGIIAVITAQGALYVLAGVVVLGVLRPTAASAPLAERADAAGNSLGVRL